VKVCNHQPARNAHTRTRSLLARTIDCQNLWHRCRVPERLTSTAGCTQLAGSSSSTASKGAHQVHGASRYLVTKLTMGTTLLHVGIGSKDHWASGHSKRKKARPGCAALRVSRLTQCVRDSGQHKDVYSLHFFIVSVDFFIIFDRLFYLIF
jgi:hypothetical protein